MIPLKTLGKSLRNTSILKKHLTFIFLFLRMSIIFIKKFAEIYVTFPRTLTLAGGSQTIP